MSYMETILAAVIFGAGFLGWVEYRQADALERIAVVLESIEWEDVEE